MSFADIITCVASAYGGYRLWEDVRIWWRRRKLRQAFAEYQRSLVDITTRFVSGVALTARPEVPATWNELVACETVRPEAAIEQVCDHADCAAARAAERRAVN